MTVLPQSRETASAHCELHDTTTTPQCQCVSSLFLNWRNPLRPAARTITHHIELSQSPCKETVVFIRAPIHSISHRQSSVNIYCMMGRDKAEAWGGDALYGSAPPLERGQTCLCCSFACMNVWCMSVLLGCRECFSFFVHLCAFTECVCVCAHSLLIVL